MQGWLQEGQKQDSHQNVQGCLLQLSSKTATQAARRQASKQASKRQAGRDSMMTACGQAMISICPVPGSATFATISALQCQLRYWYKLT